LLDSVLDSENVRARISNGYRELEALLTDFDKSLKRFSDTTALLLSLFSLQLGALKRRRLVLTFDNNKA